MTTFQKKYKIERTNNHEKLSKQTHRVVSFDNSPCLFHPVFCSLACFFRRGGRDSSSGRHTSRRGTGGGRNGFQGRKSCKIRRPPSHARGGNKSEYQNLRQRGRHTHAGILPDCRQVPDGKRCCIGHFPGVFKG